MLVMLVMFSYWVYTREIVTRYAHEMQGQNITNIPDITFQNKLSCFDVTNRHTALPSLTPADLIA